MKPQPSTLTPVRVIGTLGELGQGFSPAYLGRLGRPVQLHRPELLAEIPLQFFALEPSTRQGWPARGQVLQR
ncbi:MAG: hypothetical protein SFU83_02735 [Meiothermus sp.]|nr:hypothetical protein [Meiothermus sp.]